MKNTGLHICRRKSLVRAVMALSLLAVLLPGKRISYAEDRKMHHSEGQVVIQLPPPVKKGEMSLEETLQKRESVREFAAKPLTQEQLSRLLWSLQGTTRPWGARTAPSAGALFPLEAYVATPEGVFQYAPRKHHLVRRTGQDVRGILARAALGQACVRDAPAVFVITAVNQRMAGKYGSRAERYVKMEAGHAGQNLLLQAVSLGLGAVPVGAFHDGEVREVLNLPAGEEPLYLIPVGWRR